MKTHYDNKTVNTAAAARIVVIVIASLPSICDELGICRASLPFQSSLS